jgi:hypothetical protein
VTASAAKVEDPLGVACRLKVAPAPSPSAGSGEDPTGKCESSSGATGLSPDGKPYSFSNARYVVHVVPGVALFLLPAKQNRKPLRS